MRHDSSDMCGVAAWLGAPCQTSRPIVAVPHGVLSSAAKRAWMCSWRRTELRRAAMWEGQGWKVERRRVGKAARWCQMRMETEKTSLVVLTLMAGRVTSH